MAVLDRNAEAARSVVEQAGATTIPVTVDVADRASVTAAIAEVFETFGRVDVCINAAGIPNPGKVFGKSGPLDIEQFQRVIDVNLVGAFDVMRQCALDLCLVKQGSAVWSMPGVRRQRAPGDAARGCPFASRRSSSLCQSAVPIPQPRLGALSAAEVAHGG